MSIPVPTPAGKPPRRQVVDWKTLVRQYENLNAPNLEYQFSNGKNFYRNPNSRTGIYEL